MSDYNNGFPIVFTTLNAFKERIEFFHENDYFFRSPRFKSKIEPAHIIVEDPPAKEAQNEMPMIYTVGPMLTMSMYTASCRRLHSRSLLTDFLSLLIILDKPRTIY